MVDKIALGKYNYNMVEAEKRFKEDVLNADKTAPGDDNEPYSARMSQRVVLSNLVMILLITLPFFHLFPQSQNGRYDVAVSMITTICNNTTWPAYSGMDDESKPFIIGIIDGNTLTGRFQKILSQEIIKGKKIIIQVIPADGPVSQCHALLLFPPDQENQEQILQNARNRAILTFGIFDEKAKNEYHVNFIFTTPVGKSGKIGFSINVARLRESRLKMHNHVLRYANDIIDPWRGDIQ